MTEEKKVTPQEYWAGFPEAPASDTVKWIDKDGFVHMTTIRTWSIEGLAERISKLEDRVKILKVENGELGSVLLNLKQHVFDLKKQVIDHHDSGCHISIKN